MKLVTCIMWCWLLIETIEYHFDPANWQERNRLCGDLESEASVLNKPLYGIHYVNLVEFLLLIPHPFPLSYSFFFLRGRQFIYWNDMVVYRSIFKWNCQFVLCDFRVSRSFPMVFHGSLICWYCMFGEWFRPIWQILHESNWLEGEEETVLDSKVFTFTVLLVSYLVYLRDQQIFEYGFQLTDEFRSSSSLLKGEPKCSRPLPFQ